MKKAVFLITIIVLLTGCAGGTLGGLFPAPKILDGSLDDLRYTSPDKSFAVTAPVTTARSEWLYTEVKEKFQDSEDQKSQFVGFKPPYNSHFYSVEVVSFKGSKQLEKNSAELIAQNNISRITNGTNKRWGTEVVELAKSKLVCPNGNFTYTVLKQDINNESLKFYKYLVISQGYEGNKFALITSELNYEQDVEGSFIDEFTKRLVDLGYSKHNDFVCSVSLNPNESGS
ncbi:MAG: hypothetical protein CMP47_16165 [Rickettsiales bacterium]|jgi:hypothetical protein|nr:hypothetical protein [Rickettsiales bacterium]